MLGIYLLNLQIAGKYHTPVHQISELNKAISTMTLSLVKWKHSLKKRRNDSGRCRRDETC